MKGNYFLLFNPLRGSPLKSCLNSEVYYPATEHGFSFLAHCGLDVKKHEWSWDHSSKEGRKEISV